MSLFAELTNSVNAVRPTRTTMRNYDLPLVVATSLLVAIGILMVYSAAIALADGPKFANYGRYYFVMRQTLYVGIGLFVAAFVLTVPIETWQRTTMWIFIITMLLLVLVLIPGIGRKVNGAMRWLPVGPVTFQPSELMKLAALLFTADYTIRKQDQMHSTLRGFLPIAVALAVVAGLLLKEPDLGAVIVVIAISMGILFLGGINAHIFSGIALLLTSGFALDYLAVSLQNTAHLCLLRPLESRKSTERLLSAFAFISGDWSRTMDRCWIGWERRKASLFTRSTHRLHHGRDRRRARVYRHFIDDYLIRCFGSSLY